MSGDRRPQFDQHNLYDKTPLPSSVPAVREIGATSAPLLSASFFIGSRCHEYNDDYMQCKKEANGRGEIECLLEGRRVTRCARSVLKDLTTECLREFRSHWNCLEKNNHALYQCRAPEWRLNQCAFDKLGLEKFIPDQPINKVPVHLRRTQIFADRRRPYGEPFPRDISKMDEMAEKQAAAARAAMASTDAPQPAA